jgi:hypothetical protein
LQVNNVKHLKWKLKGTGKKRDKGKCCLCLGEEDVKHIFLNCSEAIEYRHELKLNKKKEVACNKMLTCRPTNKALLVELGRYLDKVKYKWVNKIKYL